MSEGSRKGEVALTEAMRATLARTDVAAGETVVRQGDEGRRFYLVEAGALDVILTSEEGLRLPVARLGPGSHFGEMSLLGGTPVSADVVAILFAFHVLSLPWLDEISLHIGWGGGDLVKVSLLRIIQGSALGVGGLMTLWGLWRLCRQRFGPKLVTSVAVWMPSGFLAAAYLDGAMILLGRA